MKFAKSILWIILVLVMMACRLEAGVLMVNASQSSDHPDKVLTDRLYIDKDRVRLEEGSGQIAIFRQDKEVFWLIDNKDQTYTEMTKQDLQKMKSKMDEASRQMEEQMKNMPPEQRQMMEQMMAGKMLPKPEISYQKVASGETVNQWICNKYEGSLNGKKQSEVWTTDWKNLGLRLEDFNALKEMGEFFSEFTHDAGSFYKMGDTSDQGHYSGVPIKTIGHSGDRATHTTELKEIQRQDFAASLFELPEGFKKKDLGMEQGEE